MQSMEILGRIKSYLEKSGKRNYPGVRWEEQILCPEKKSGLGKWFLEPALLPRLLRTEAEKSKGMLII